MPVSVSNSKVLYDALKQCGVGLVSALPETWLVHLIRMAEDDPEMILVRLAREEEAVGISATAHLPGMHLPDPSSNACFPATGCLIVSRDILSPQLLLILRVHRGKLLR